MTEMPQKELTDKCRLNKSTTRSYELGNRYPDKTPLLNTANSLGWGFYTLSGSNVANLFSTLHILYDIE